MVVFCRESGEPQERGSEMGKVNNRRLLQSSFKIRFASTLTMLTNKMQIIQITAHIIPQPISATIEHHAILLPIVIVRLLFAPRRLQDGITFNERAQLEMPHTSLNCSCSNLMACIMITAIA